MTLQLIKPSKQQINAIRNAIAEYQSAPEKFTISAVKNMIDAVNDDFAQYFAKLENASLGINIKSGYVPNTVYWLFDDDKYVGTFDLRHSLTPNLECIGGHIAYQILPSARRRGYACAGLKLCLLKASEMGIAQVLVTCNAENIASYAVMRKVMLEVGGYEAEPYKTNNLIERRVWINTKITNA